MTRDVAFYKQEITRLNECLRKKNLALMALHYVFCSGGCESGIANSEEVTEELVQMAERNTQRLRQWWTNKQYRDRRES